MQQVVQKKSHEAVQTIDVKEIKKIKIKSKNKKNFNFFVIYYALNFFFRFKLFLSCCFSLLSAFLSSMLFPDNSVYCEIIDCYFNVFFVEMQLKKKLKKRFMGAKICGSKPVYQPPKWSGYMTTESN